MADWAYGKTALKSVNSQIHKGASSSQDAINSQKSGVDAVLSGQGAVNSAVGNMNAQANNILGQANAVNDTADAARGVYDQLSPIAGTLGDYGNAMWEQGQSLATEAKDVFGQGRALVSMDPTASGLAGEFVKYWQSLSPDRFVSQAAGDVQGAQQNSLSQAQRNLMRMGVSPTSGAYGALQKQYQQSLATALAAAKTKARQTGLDLQASQLGKMVDAANTLYNMGNQTQQTATAAQNAAAGAQKDAANVIAAQGSGYAQVADLQAKAGTLFGQAADVFKDAAALNTSYLNSLETAYGNLAKAQQSAASYYASTANIEANAANGVGGGTQIINQGAYEAERAARDAEFHALYEKNKTY